MPEMGHHWLATELDLKDMRVWPLIPTFKRFLIFYRPIKGGIEILRVVHSAQDVTTLIEDEDEEQLN